MYSSSVYKAVISSRCGKLLSPCPFGVTSYFLVWSGFVLLGNVQNSNSLQAFANKIETRRKNVYLCFNLDSSRSKELWAILETQRSSGFKSQTSHGIRKQWCIPAAPACPYRMWNVVVLWVVEASWCVLWLLAWKKVWDSDFPQVSVLC